MCLKIVSVTLTCDDEFTWAMYMYINLLHETPQDQSLAVPMYPMPIEVSGDSHCNMKRIVDTN